MSDADIFHEGMLYFGGRLGSYPDKLSPYLEMLRDRAQQVLDLEKKCIPRLPNIYFNFVDNPEINAYAFTRQGRYFIGFFVGTMYLLNTMFSRMLSDRRILPTVGNIQLEAENPQSLQGLPLDAKEACASGFYPSEPQCPVRSWWKGRLTLIAFFFLVKHEITHIADGHVDYWSKRHGTPFLGELGRTGPSESDVLTRQSLEVMADTVLSAILS